MDSRRMEHREGSDTTLRAAWLTAAAGAVVLAGIAPDIRLDDAGGVRIGLVSRAALAQQSDADKKSDAEKKSDADKPAEEKKDDAGAPAGVDKTPEQIERERMIQRLREQAAKQGVKFSIPETGKAPPAQPAAQPAAKSATQPAAQPAAQPGAQSPSQPNVRPQPGAQPAQPVQPVPVPDVQGPPVPLAPGQPMAPAGASAQPAADADIVPEGFVRLEFTDAVQIPVLINWVRDTLNIQLILSDAGLQGQTVTFTAPITIRKADLMDFLIGVLEGKDYTIVQDKLGIFQVQPRSAIQPAIGSGDYTTTRVLRTPNIRPSTLQQVIANVINVNRQGGVQNAQPTFLDDIGVIIMTDTPRVLDLVQSLIDTIVTERAALEFSRYPLDHVAATSARDRVLELMGQATQRLSAGVPGQPNQPQIVGVSSPSTLNINERLTVDPASNALLFRGRPDEQKLLADTLKLVDVPNTLEQRFYPVGLATAEAVANAGAKEQLGGSTTFESSTGRGGATTGRVGVPQPGVPGFPQQANEVVGVGFVIYPESGGFMYRGTPAQHQRVQALIAQLKDLSERDRVTIEFYKLKHGKAEEVATVIQNLLSNTAPTGNRGGLLGRDLGGATRQRTNQLNRQRDPQAAANAALNQNGAEAGLGDLDGEDVFVISDDQNNQVVVKARAKLQPQFKQLIDRIDLRRPQVYLDAKIVVVSSTDGLDLTVEAQQIIGQFAFNTNFGLGSLTSGTGTTTTGGITSPKVPNPNLTGVTAALIRSRDVPLLINALARDTKGRTIATPQLLVDDNSEAVIESIEQRPTSTTQVQTGQPNVTSFGGFEDAGPRLTVTPQIAEGGYLRLDYEVELSSFVGEGSANLPPPRLRNRVTSESVTVPTDHTIVVGGLTQEATSKTILKIPLLGDIPLIGNLFKDQNFTKTTTTLFVFITPKIMRDPTFADLRLITSKPLVTLDMPTELPAPEPVRINVVDGADAQDRRRDSDARKENKRRDSFEPKEDIYPFD